MSPTRLLLSACFLMGMAPVHADSPDHVDIVYLGDSITAGATLPPGASNPPSVCTQTLRDKMPHATICDSNQGHGGHTTVDFLPATNTDFPAAENAARKLQDAHVEKGILVFSILIGTNDSAADKTLGAPVSPEHFRANLTTIIEQLLSDFPESRVCIHEPIWYSPNTHNSATYEQQGLDRLDSYIPIIEEVVCGENLKHRDHVFLGDTKAHAYFHLHYQQELTPEEGVKGTFYLHPNAAGAVSLGRFWAEAMLASDALKMPWEFPFGSRAMDHSH